jgi:hypothetical protein
LALNTNQQEIVSFCLQESQFKIIRNLLNETNESAVRKLKTLFEPSHRVLKFPKSGHFGACSDALSALYDMNRVIDNLPNSLA